MSGDAFSFVFVILIASKLSIPLLSEAHSVYQSLCRSISVSLCVYVFMCVHGTYGGQQAIFRTWLFFHHVGPGE